MTDGIEARAGIVAGGMVARHASAAAVGAAADPHAATRNDTDGRCRNCDTELIGRHCHACGQAAHVHRTIGALWHDIGHAVFHFEGKAWRTLPMLLWRPGELTRRYVAGERARFVSPMALFLFSVFLMFAVVANLPGWRLGRGDLVTPDVAAGMARARAQLAEARATATSQIDATTGRLANERAKAAPDGARVARYEQRLARLTAQRDDAARAESLLLPTADRASDTSPASRSSDGHWLERKWQHAKENPELVFYKLKTSAYKFSWVLIPLSLPFVWVLFPFRRTVGLYDHAVFTTYSLTFMSLLTIALALLGAIGVGGPALLLTAAILPPLHIYRQLKGAYGLGRWSALARTAALVVMILALIVPLFALLLAYLGVA